MAAATSISRFTLREVVEEQFAGLVQDRWHTESTVFQEVFVVNDCQLDELRRREAVWRDTLDKLVDKVIGCWANYPQPPTSLCEPNPWGVLPPLSRVAFHAKVAVAGTLIDLRPSPKMIRGAFISGVHHDIQRRCLDHLDSTTPPYPTGTTDGLCFVKKLMRITPVVFSDIIKDDDDTIRSAAANGFDKAGVAVTLGDWLVEDERHVTLKFTWDEPLTPKKLKEVMFQLDMAFSDYRNEGKRPIDSQITFARTPVLHL